MISSNPAARREAILQAAIARGLLDPENVPLAAFIDVDALAENVSTLKRAFPETVNVLHAFAAKANSIVPVLAGLRDLGLGCEVASEGELAQALAAGFEPESIVFDSPAKTVRELRKALALGVALNIDNFQEFERIQRIVEQSPSSSPLGFRINPQIGVGAIAEMSTAGSHSKFGVALEDPGNREALLAAYAGNPSLNRLHAHVGSQGCPLPLMAAGVAKIVALAQEINNHIGRQQVTTIDIGGGLPVDFQSDSALSNFSAYVDHLRETVPALLNGDFALVTEFGRSILAKFGFTAAYVEYTKVSGGQHIAITHAGANVATRTVFMPHAWPLRVTAHGPDGKEKSGNPVGQDIAGPCCFAGDMVARDRPLPLLEPGDVVALLDTGAYYASTPFTYNSIQEPPVYGATFEDDGDVSFTVLRAQQTMADLLTASGSELADPAKRQRWAGAVSGRQKF
ncbi:diaminopimelate decarboxylase [Arthrobacter sp. GMC3]|uniref:diaminopimelate decarboxylase n=1 Tax=Arthrobacter sp. GMC3 TaxID=2058894 RepID=UPI000CE46217|nr:diaminopimelate decarboxylase [Arthrobacter sp. GMC3]